MKDGQGISPNIPYCLILDERGHARSSSAVFLSRNGVKSIVAPTGIAALKRAIFEMPRMVIVHWPNADAQALKFVQSVRNLPGADHLYILFTGGPDSISDIHRAMAAGASDYLIQPADQSLLQFKLDQAGLLRSLQAA